MKPNAKEAKQVLIRAFTSFGEMSEKQTHELVFHLTDWLDDLQAYAEFVENPKVMNDDEVRAFVIKLLAHVPYHVNEASKLIFDAVERAGDEGKS